MFDMATISMGSNLMSPMNGASVPMGSLTPSVDMKYSSVASPHSHSPMSTPGSTPNSMVSNGGKSVSNSKDWHMSLMSDENELFGSKCKRKINFSHIGIPKGVQPATVARRNARERNRVKQVNNGFSALKQHIPLGHRSKKMSKVETLRCAVEYIKNLKTMLDLNGALSSSTPSSTISSGNDSNDLSHHFGSNASEFGSSGDAVSHYHHAHHHQQHFGPSSGSTTTTVPAGSHQLSPSSSEDPSSPSYASEASYITSSSNNNNNNNNNNAANMYDYEKYEPVSPEDEELLDAISWWQQS